MAVEFCSILWIIFFSGNAISAEEIYTNVWAVKVRGSQQEAVELAVKYGLSYDEHVRDSLYMYMLSESNWSQLLKIASELVEHFVDIMKDNETHLVFTNIYPESSYWQPYSREEGKNSTV